MSTPTISVVLPVYNASHCVKETLDSLKRQTFTDFEVIIVDDESSDETPEIIEEYAAKDKRFKLLRKTNGGTAAKSAAYALPHCRGKYFFFCSHDDFFSEDLFAQMIKRADETEAQCIIPECVFYYENVPLEKQKKLGPPNGDYARVISGKEAFMLAVDGWKIAGCGLKELSSFRASGFESEFFNSDEFSVWRHFLNSEKVAFSHGTYFYRQTPTAITARIHPLRFETLCVNEKILTLIENLQVSDDTLHWKKFLWKRMKSTIGEIRTSKKKLRSSKFSDDKQKRIEEIIKSSEKTLLKRIIKHRFWSLLIRFFWKLKIS